MEEKPLRWSGAGIRYQVMYERKGKNSWRVCTPNVDRVVQTKFWLAVKAAMTAERNKTSNPKIWEGKKLVTVTVEVD